MIRRIGQRDPTAVIRRETVEGGPTSTPGIPLDALCEALDLLPDEAEQVSFVFTTEGAELYWGNGESWTKYAVISGDESPDNGVLPGIE